MQINRVILENYGLYDGRHEFDLAPRVKYGKKRPIVLFGGKNGAGKTTFLDSIQLAFYGRAAVRVRCSEAQYDKALGAKIHRSKKDSAVRSFALIGIEFDTIASGEKQQFYIERSWTKANGKLKKYFKVLKDGEPLRDVATEHWEAFIADMVPAQLSQLFFFDGEKIQQIAEGVTSQSAISEAIQSLLGLDIVDKLNADLGIYVSRLASDCDAEQVEAEIAEVRAKVEELEGKIAKIEEVTLPAARTAVLGLENEERSAEVKVRSAGGAFADARAGNEQRKAQLEGEVTSMKSAIRSETESTFCFSLCPNYVSLCESQIERERSARQGRVVRGELLRLQESFSAVLAEGSKRQSAREKELLGILERRLTAVPEAKDAEIQGLADADAATVISKLTVEAASSADRLVDNCHQLEQLERELARVAKEIDRAPEEEDIEPLFRALTEASSKLGAARQYLVQIEEELKSHEILLEALKRRLEKAEQKVAAFSKHGEKVKMVSRIRPALTEYRRRLTQLKLDELESAVTSCYGHLARKDDFVHKVAIDPHTFAVTVHDRDGHCIPMEDLSSGEKQIFAIAMLWGLARTSGRPLPVVIDTPLGRLDSDHRMNLIRNYFPEASHQVIMFSTDTEVEKNLFKELSPNVSHCYHLIYDSDDQSTHAEQGYFWRNGKDG